MERQDFLPHAVLPGENSLRDLPPAERGAIPCAEHAEGHGCGCDGHGSEMQGGTCIGHEGCGEGSWGLTGHPLAMVYAPCQAFRALYDPMTALNRGTLFTELDLPLGGTEGSFTTIGCSCSTERRGR